jgi:HEAT repeat protein
MYLRKREIVMPSEKLTAILEQVPGIDNQSLSSAAEVEKVERALEPLLTADGELVRECITLLREPAASDKTDQKVRYVLHIAAVKLGGGKSEEARAKFATVIAAALAGDLPVNAKRYLVRELQVCGDEESTPALGKLLTHDDSELADSAAQALIAIRAGAAEQFRAALEGAKGPQRLIIVQNLGVLADKKSLAELQKSLADEDVEIRLAAAWALANIGDAAAADALVKAAGKEQGFAQSRADDACLLLAEKLRAAGNTKKAQEIYTHLRDTRQDASQRHVREAAERGIAASP